MRFDWFVVAAFPAMLIASGCARPRHDDYRSTHTIAVSDPSEADRLWAAAQETLRYHRLPLDRVDRAAGVITTLPETSQQWFEFWRRDVVTTRDQWEAAVNPMRRWVEVTLTPSPEGGWSAVAVVVHKERLSSPDRQFNSSGAAYQYFSESLPSTTGRYRVTAKDDRWLDIGRDAAMEDLLLSEIIEQCPTTPRADAGGS